MSRDYQHPCPAAAIGNGAGAFDDHEIEQLTTSGCPIGWQSSILARRPRWGRQSPCRRAGNVDHQGDAMPVNDPVMAVLDKLPLSSSPDLGVAGGLAIVDDGPVPFGLRFAVSPVVPCDKHKKTYYTVTVKEATVITKDGSSVTIQDDVQRERED